MNVPYFNNVNDYVDSLPYGKPLKDNGFIYESPFNSIYGERPEVVYERLFKQDHYYGLTDEELTKRFKEAIRIDNEERRIKGEPIAKYDTEKRRAYLEFPDGRRQYAN